jgi:uracil-DNA glycosylase family 4
MRAPVRIEAEFLKCTCDREECPVFSRCCRLPTELAPSVDGSIQILFSGQGGGADERRKIQPFIGRAGKRLRRIVTHVRKKLNKHIGVAFSNTIRDNPEANRAPTSVEEDFCLPFLYGDIKTLKKRGLKVVMPLGNYAKKPLIRESNKPISRDRENVYRVCNKIFGDVLMIPTFHPSYLIRNASTFYEHHPSDLDKMVIDDIVKAYRVGMKATLDDPDKRLEIEMGQFPF